MLAEHLRVTSDLTKSQQAQRVLLLSQAKAHNSTHPDDLHKVRIRRRMPVVIDSRNNIRFPTQYPIESDLNTILAQKPNFLS